MIPISIPFLNPITGFVALATLISLLIELLFTVGSYSPIEFNQLYWWLLIILLLFSWMGYVGVVRAEFLRARNFDYIRAAKALGVSNTRIMIRHMLPNATIATVTFLPFSLSASVTALSGLDFLGFGLPPGSASLGEMVNQGRNNLQAPWLGITSFLTLGIMLGLLVFVGEAIRDSLDPRKTFS